MSPGIFSSAPRCYIKRTEPPLHSGFVGRPPATLEKRIPINQSERLMPALVLVFRVISLVALWVALAIPAHSQGSKSSPPAKSSTGVSKLQQVEQALFLIELEESQGSGFQYRTPGYVLTNRHVVDSAAIGSPVKLRPVHSSADGLVKVGQPIQGTLRFKHPELDIAVIEISPSVTKTILAPKLEALTSHVARGTELWGHGFPGIGASATPTISKGMLSAHYQDPLTGELFYVCDVALSPGSSGGPVTDSTGAVIGVATAVSIVTDGAGTSWGYVLPINSIDAALACKGGWAALPKPLDQSRCIATIKAARSPEKAIAAFAVAAREAMKKCSGAIELANSLVAFENQLFQCPGRMSVDSFAQFNGAENAIRVEILARFLEFLCSGEVGAASAQEAFRTYLVLPGREEWTARLGGEMIEAVPEAQRPLAIASILRSHAAALTGAMDRCGGLCSELTVVAHAIEEEKAVDRKQIRKFANSFASLANAYAQLGSIDPNSLDPDAEGLTTAARQEFRTAKTAMQNCADKWKDIPAECREVVEGFYTGLIDEAGGAPDDGSAPDPTPAPNSGRGTSVEVIESISALDLQAILQEEGYHCTIDKDGDLSWKVEGVNCVLSRSGDGAVLQFHVGFKAPRTTLAKVNEWNKSKRFSRSYLDAENDPTLELDLDLAGGVARKRIVDFLQTCVVSLRGWREEVLK